MSKSTKEKLRIPTIGLTLMNVGLFIINMTIGSPVSMVIAAVNVIAIVALLVALRELYTP